MSWIILYCQFYIKEHSVTYKNFELISDSKEGAIMPKFASKEICTDCTACKSVCPRQCIEMKPDTEGFAYPEIKDVLACINCKK